MEEVPASANHATIASPARATRTSANTSMLGKSLGRVPATVTIPAGSTSANFNITVANDGLLDGAQTAVISATAPLYFPADDSITINDDESAVITLTLPGSATEGDGTLTNAGTVTLSIAPAEDVVIALASNDVTEATVPSTVTVLAGQTSANFDITVTDDTEIDNTSAATITADAGGAWTSDAAAINVADNDSYMFLTLPSAVSEGVGGTCEKVTFPFSSTILYT